jgi:transcriptional regulator with XRE-family HTH domain
MTSQTKRMPNATDVQVGSRLRARRMALGLSQTHLAEAMGLTFQQIQKYEKGTNRIGAGRLYQLAEVLRVDPEFFFENEIGQKPPASSPSDYFTEFLATPEGVALVNAFRKVPSATLRRRLLALVQKLADLEN